MVKVELSLEEVEIKGYKLAYRPWVKVCYYVHMTDDTIRPLGSGEE